MRPIVKSAMKISELEFQFTDLDNVTWKQVDEHYADSYIIQEAKWRLDTCMENVENLDEWDEDYQSWLKDSKILKRFINTWKGKCQPHKNDGLKWEELEPLIKGAN